MEEEWRKISDFPNYEVSNLGRVRSWISTQGKIREAPLIKTACNNGRGYLKVSLEGDKHRLVHRLVAAAFLEPVIGKTTVDHINRNRQDNRAVNLRWADSLEQQNNRFRNENFCIYTRNNTYRVFIARKRITLLNKTYKSLEEAIQARDEFLATNNLLTS